MEEKKYSSLEEIILYENIRLIQTALHIFITTRRLYGSKEDYDDPVFVHNLSPVVRNFNARLFRGEDSQVLIDLLLTVSTTIKNVYGIETLYNGVFTFNLSCILDHGIKKFRILNLEYGDKLRPFDKKRSLNSILIPYIYYENYEQEAEEFLNKYCPEVLQDPIPLPVDEVVKKMGLKKIYAVLENNIRGIISFRKNSFLQTDYCTDGCLTKEVDVDPGTIVIEENLLFESGIGPHNNTVIHECLHWYLHRAYQELQIALNNGKSIIVSPSDDEMDNHKEEIRDDLYYIENQVRQLTPLILMPRRSAISKFEQLIAKYKDEYGIKSMQVIYKAATKEFASFFNVSLESAKIRIHSLGYSENLYKNQLEYNTSTKQVRFISNWDFDLLFESNKEFNLLVNKKIVVYIDGYVVINISPYIIENDKGVKLSDFGLRNILDCTLSFKISRNRDIGFRKSHPFAYAMLHHELTTTSKQISINDDYLDQILKVMKNTKDIEKQKSFFRDFRLAEENYSYNEYLHILMERHQSSVNQLVISSRLSESLIKKYRAMTETTYTLEATLAICAGLKLYPYESLNLLSIMGWDYEGMIKKGVKVLDKFKHYYHLIVNEYNSGLIKWNEYLVSKGFRELP